MCNPVGRIRRGKRRIRHLHRATGGCGVNALSTLRVRSVGRIRRGKRRIRHLHRGTGGCGVNALSTLHVQSPRPDKTRQAPHPAFAPRHWWMRRKRLIHPTCAFRRPDKARQAPHPASAPRHWWMRRKRLIHPTCPAFIAPLRTGRQSAPGWRYAGCYADKYRPARPAPMCRNVRLLPPHQPVVYRSQLPQSAHLPR